MKVISRHLIFFSLIASAIIPHAARSAILSDSEIARMSPQAKMAAQTYFKAHSFDFHSLFSAYHPGPYWILKNKNDFNLTTAQVKQEEKLKMEMAQRTLEDETALKQAYDTYTTDAARAEPNLQEILSDIEVVGKTQTSLASEMVDYHLKAYALLTAQQKTTYQKLVADKISKRRSGNQ